MSLVSDEFSTEQQTSTIKFLTKEPQEASVHFLDHFYPHMAHRGLLDRGGSPAGDPLDRSPAHHRANTDENPQFRLIHSPRKPVSGLWEVTEVTGEKPPRHRENMQSLKRKTGTEI